MFPDFGMALAGVGANYYSQLYNDSEKGEYHYRRALELVDRVTDRERRIIETEFAAHRDHLDEASRLYRAFLTLYPDDLMMQLGYAKLLMGNRRYEDAAAAYGEVLRIEPDDASANINYGACQAGLGNYEIAVVSYERAFEFEPAWQDWGNINHEYGFFYVRLGRMDQARAIFDHASAANPANHGPHRSLGLLALFEGRIGEARRQFDTTIELSQGDDLRLSRSRNYLFASLTSRWEGDPQRHVEELSRAAQLLGELGPQPNWWFRIGIEQALCGELSQAKQTLRLAGEQIDPKNDAHQAGLLRLRGEVALAEGDFDGGIELLEASIREYPMPATSESLAFAYTRQGVSDDAVAALRAFVEEPPIPVGWEPQMRWQEAHVVLAAMYVEREQPELAIPLLDSILESWSGADPDFALAIEARELRERL